VIESFATIEAIYKVVRKNVSAQQMEKIIDDLLQVPGNQSFRETIERLVAINARR
jgi:hypothetical protein